jgi:hypothetical protein
MQFKFLFAAAAVATSVTAQATVGDLSNSLKDIADSITDGIETIKDISPSTVTTIIPKLAVNFKEITDTIGKFSKDLGEIDPAKFPKSAESDICDTYSDFFEVYNNLVDVVIGDDGALARIPASIITLPIAGIFQVANSAINNFVQSFIQLIPNCRESAQKDLEEANKKFADAIQNFANNVYRPVGGGFGGLFGKDN